MEIENNHVGVMNNIYLYKIPLFIEALSGSSKGNKLLRLSTKYILVNNERIELNTGIEDLDWPVMEDLYRKNPDLHMPYAYLRYKDITIYSVYI